MRRGYRQNVGIMLINPKGQVWMGVRSNPTDSPYRLQMPQGGIDAGENPTEAVWRELQEETGLTPRSVKMIAIAKKWHKYDLPPALFPRRTIKGQRQKWFLFLLTGNEADISLENGVYQEFIDYKWVDIDEIADLVIPFKRAVYESVVAEFRPFVDSYQTKERK